MGVNIRNVYHLNVSTQCLLYVRPDLYVLQTCACQDKVYVPRPFAPDNPGETAVYHTVVSRPMMNQVKFDRGVPTFPSCEGMSDWTLRFSGATNIYPGKHYFEGP